MEEVTIDKNALALQLLENRKKHESDFNEAERKYRQKAISELEKRLAHIKAGGEIDLVFNLPVPREYLSSFDDAIKMLEWEQNETVTLTESDFRQYVMNKWEWTRHFIAGTSAYIGK